MTLPPDICRAMTFPDAETAGVALKAIQSRGLHQARIYTCKECGGLHVGVEPEDERTVD